MKKSKTKTYIMVLFFFIGLMILFYPSLADYSNQKLQSKAIDNYEELIKNIEVEDYSEYFAKGTEYNNKLMNIKNAIAKKNLGLEDPSDIFNVDGNGMIGYL